MKFNNASKNIADFRASFASENKSINSHLIPSILKVTVSIRLGNNRGDKNLIASLSQDLSNITGQKPVISRAKFSNASFKIREGDPIAIRVTLRHRNMMSFLDRLIYMAMPRMRDFNGLSNKSFDKSFNYSFTISDSTVFYEASQDAILRNLGLDISINTSGCSSKSDAVALLRAVGLPLSS